MKSKNNIGIVIFSYYKDEDFLILCLKGLLHTISKHPEYNVRVFVVDDNNMKQKISLLILVNLKSKKILMKIFMSQKLHIMMCI